MGKSWEKSQEQVVRRRPCFERALDVLIGSDKCPRGCSGAGTQFEDCAYCPSLPCPPDFSHVLGAMVVRTSHNKKEKQDKKHAKKKAQQKEKAQAPKRVVTLLPHSQGWAKQDTSSVAEQKKKKEQRKIHKEKKKKEQEEKKQQQQQA